MVEDTDRALRPRRCSSALQRLAARLSSGGDGNYNSRGGGVIRGFLQSLRGHATESGSPRTSRSGQAASGRSTPSESYGQFMFSSVDDLHAAADLCDGDARISAGNADPHGMRVRHSPGIHARLLSSADGIRFTATSGPQEPNNASPASTRTISHRRHEQKTIDDLDSPSASVSRGGSASWIAALFRSREIIDDDGSSTAASRSGASSPHVRSVCASVSNSGAGGVAAVLASSGIMAPQPTPTAFPAPLSAEKPTSLLACEIEPLASFPPEISPFSGAAALAAAAESASAALPAPAATPALAEAFIGPGCRLAMPGSTPVVASRPGIDDLLSPAGLSCDYIASAADATATTPVNNSGGSSGDRSTGDGSGGDGSRPPLQTAATEDIVLTEPQPAPELTERPEPQPPLRCHSSSQELSAIAVSLAVQRLQQRQQQEKAAARLLRFPSHTLSQQHPHPHQDRPPNSPCQIRRALAAAAGGGGGGFNGDGDESYGDGGRSEQQQPPLTSPASQPLMRPPPFNAARRSAPQSIAPQPRPASSHAAFHQPLARSYQQQQQQQQQGQQSLQQQLQLRDSGRMYPVALGSLGSLGLGFGLGGSSGSMGGSFQSDMRSCLSLTEASGSAAGRLRALVHSAASDDDSASFLQQLLLPSASTASAELQYSGSLAHASAAPYAATTTTTMPRASSALELANCGGAAVATAAGVDSPGQAKEAAGSAAEGCWGDGWAGTDLGRANERCPQTQQPHSPRQASISATVKTDHKRPSTGSVGWCPVSVAAASKRADSTSLLVGPRRPPASPSPASSSSFLAGGPAHGHPSAASVATSGNSGRPGSSSYGGGGCPHAGKSAEQLVRELRELRAEEHAGGGDGGGGGGGAPPGSTQARAAEAEGTAVGVVTALEAAADDARTAGQGLQQQQGVRPAAQQQQQQRQAELVAALWRLVHAKDSDAVGYLMGLDPGRLENAPIAAVIQEVRSWTFVSMW